MIRTAAGLALLLSSVTLLAQNSFPSGVTTFGVASPQSSPEAIPVFPGKTVTIYLASSAGCPIGMHASQSLWDRGTIRVHDGNRQRALEQFGQRIALALEDPHPARIVAATVRVRGLNGKNRAIPTPADTTQEWNAVKTLKVNFTEDQNGTVSADLWLGGFTSVGSIQLLKVFYADGYVWTIFQSSACRVQPDPIMLITRQ
jgi:hypothetical protein